MGHEPSEDTMEKCEILTLSNLITGIREYCWLLFNSLPSPKKYLHVPGEFLLGPVKLEGGAEFPLVFRLDHKKPNDGIVYIEGAKLDDTVKSLKEDYRCSIEQILLDTGYVSAIKKAGIMYNGAKEDIIAALNCATIYHM